MKFSIITPTYKRKNLLVRAVNSLQTQTYNDWEMIIINDSPGDHTYNDFASSINDSRIHYYVNTINNGVNYCRNFGLDHVSADSRWIIFLDDDDYLAPDALTNFLELIQRQQEQKWFVTNRALQNGKPLTKFPRNETFYSYAWSYLILKRCKGDATHCIETKLITHTNARFSKYVKQGEEWFFFYQVGLYTTLFYYDHNSTISDGYDATAGLNFRKRTRTERFETITKLLYETIEKKIFYNVSIIIYLLLRYIKLIILL